MTQISLCLAKVDFSTFHRNIPKIEVHLEEVVESSNLSSLLKAFKKRKRQFNWVLRCREGFLERLSCILVFQIFINFFLQLCHVKMSAKKNRGHNSKKFWRLTRDETIFQLTFLGWKNALTPKIFETKK